MAFSQARRLDRELVDTPGVNSYETTSPIKKPGGRFANTFLKSIFDPKNANPGPNSYNTEVPVEKRSRGITFVTGKAGSSLISTEVTPGPNSYDIKFIHEYKPNRLKRLKSASLRSASKRDSEFTKMTPGPGIGKYNIVSGDAWDQEKNYNKEIHTFGPEKDRFANSFHGNLAVIRSIPGPGKYHPELIVKPVQATLGGRRSKYIGKQNEIGVKPHTFGADKDRFKNSVYGPLVDIARIPGVGEYDVGYSMDYLYKAEFMRSPSRDGTRVPGTRPTSHLGNRPPAPPRVRTADSNNRRASRPNATSGLPPTRPGTSSSRQGLTSPIRGR
jgi:hypothetical protein